MNDLTIHENYQLLLIEEMKLSQRGGGESRFKDPNYLQWKDLLEERFERDRNTVVVKPIACSEDEDGVYTESQVNQNVFNVYNSEVNNVAQHEEEEKEEDLILVKESMENNHEVKVYDIIKEFEDVNCKDEGDFLIALFVSKMEGQEIEKDDGAFYLFNHLDVKEYENVQKELREKANDVRNSFLKKGKKINAFGEYGRSNGFDVQHFSGVNFTSETKRRKLTKLSNI